jgi:hypothetical protein
MNEQVVEHRQDNCTQDASQTASLERALPDMWCFGLAHPRIQRLIFLAGALEQEAMNRDQSDRPQGQIPKSRR